MDFKNSGQEFNPALIKNKVINSNNSANKDRLREDRSTFPGIWQPSNLNKTPLLDGHQWLKGKQKFDNVGNLWRVHDKLYNLDPFITKHPGGEDWLKLSRGTDITELFESSHLINTQYVDKLLEKYYVGPAESPRNSPYTFHEKGFYKTLKSRVEPILKDVGTGPTIEARIVQDYLALSFIFCGIVGAVNESVGLLLLSGFFLNLSTVAAHNFLHIRDNWRKYYFDLSFMSSYDWRITHCASHHCYTNTILDYDAISIEPLLVFLPKASKTWIQRYGPIVYSHIFYMFGLTIAYFVKLWKSAIKGEHSLRPENLLPLMELIALIWIAPTTGSAIKSWLVIHLSCSYVITLVGLNVAHHDPTCFHDGDQPRSSPDFGLCLLDATRDSVKDFSENLLLSLTTFGEHPLHHMFPTLCHSKHAYVKPIFLQTMAEFGFEYPRQTRLQLYFGTLRQWMRNSPNILSNGNFIK